MPATLTVQDGMHEYMQRASGACHVVIRGPDDPNAAQRALKAFSRDLYDSDVFEPLDGQFGTEIDGTDIRFTPSFVSRIDVRPNELELWFDAKDVLVAWPEVIPRLIDRLLRRLGEAGVQRAEIGWPGPLSIPG